MVCVDDVTQAIDGNELDVGNGKAAIELRLLWLPPLVAPTPPPPLPPVAVGIDMQLLADRGVVGGCCGGICASGDVAGLNPISVTRDT